MGFNMGFWQLGNTSVRSAMRMRDGLIAYSQSAIQGDIRKVDGDIAFRELLGKSGVVTLGEDSTNSVGRKWRSAMGKLGFLYPEVKPSLGFSQEELGSIDMITPAGWNLIRAETVPAMQESFLRAMVTPVEEMENGKKFSPLCWTLALMLEIQKRCGDASLTFIEMAYWVQTTSPMDGVKEITDKILELRAARNAADSKRAFDRDLYDRGAAELNRAPGTFRDYADMNIRYLKATGMVQAKGRGIALVPEKAALAKELIKQLDYDEAWVNVYRTLCKGSTLPTDNVDVANQVLKELLDQLKTYGISYSIAGKPLDTPAHVNMVRYEIEEIISEKKEEVYATEQATQWEEIAAYMDLIATKKEKKKLSGDVEIRIPKAEAPAYLEWSLWRAFLAIDSLVNKPYKVRNFKIDQDFMPVSTAPGGMPDMVAEFNDCVIVIEVTLSESSRQEAMEGEPVRRHVADLVAQYDKPVYGLFIANRIDTNTAETFRNGIWYSKDDTMQRLHIVPFTLEQFCMFFRKMFENKKATPENVVSLLNACNTGRDKRSAPEWKLAIASCVREAIG